MSNPNFDPYHEWLGIPPEEQPANHYRLLGLELFETDRGVIESVSLKQIAHVRTFAIGTNSEASQLLLNELSAARVTLLNAVQKAEYDQELRQQLSSKRLEQSSATAENLEAVPAVIDVEPARLPRKPQRRLSRSFNEVNASPSDPSEKRKLYIRIGGAILLGYLVFMGILFFIRVRGVSQEIAMALNRGDYSRVLELDPDNPAALSMQQSASDLADALAQKDYKRALSIDPYNAEALILKREDLLGALLAHDYEKALDIDPKNAEAISQQKEAAAQQAVANGDYRQALELDPTNREALAMKKSASELEKDAEIEEALKAGDYARALRLDPSNAEAWELKKSMDIQQALARGDDARALKSDPNSAEALEMKNAADIQQAWADGDYSLAQELDASTADAVAMATLDASRRSHGTRPEGGDLAGLPPASEGAPILEFICHSKQVWPAFPFNIVKLQVKAILNSGAAYSPTTKNIDAVKFKKHYEAGKPGVDNYFTYNYYMQQGEPRVRLLPRKGRGRSIEEVGDPTSPLARVFSSLQRSNGAARFYVQPDSYDTFVSARKFCIQNKILARWSFEDADWTLTRNDPGGFVLGPLNAASSDNRNPDTSPTDASTSPAAPSTAPPPAIAPFDAAKSKEHQEAWAKYLGVEVKTENSIGMQLSVIPAGTFTMGEGDGAHEVTLTKPFMLGTYEVTQAQYKKVMGVNPSKFKGAKNPVEMVSWSDAVEFCRKLSELPAEKAAGRVYRLPTEAEWEFACRAGTTTKHYWGEEINLLGRFAWIRSNSRKTTHPVGEKIANAWSLYDMNGNVHEWCEDWFASHPRKPTVDPHGPTSGAKHVYRGGGWNELTRDCNSLYRASGNPHSCLGFRVSLSPSGK
jgi:formylglycine-generating enzyme required for sulfatase activity